MSNWKKIYAMLIVEKIPFKFYDKEGVDTFEIELGTLEIQCPKDGSFIVDGNEMSAEEIKVLFKGENVMKVLDKVIYKGHKGIIIGIAENGDITITYHYYQINNIVYTNKTVKEEQLEVL